MDALMHDPGLWTAFAALIGVLVGAFSTRRTSKEDIAVKRLVAQTADDAQDFEALHTTVTVLQTEQARLRSDIQELRQQMDEMNLRHRRLGEKYSSAVAYINLLRMRGRELLARLDTHGIPHGEIPEPPENIVDDLKS